VTPGREEGAASGNPRARRPSRCGDAGLPHAFFARPSKKVARELLGAHLVSEVDGLRCVAEIVEVEAYVGPHDDASHAAARLGRTRRNEAMFGPPGTAYVYLIYGLHWCINVVTDAEDYPAAVLLRAGRPVEGIETARARRGGRPDRDLMRGPGNLARALGVDGTFDRHPLDRPPLRLAAGAVHPDDAVATGPRIGITRAADWPLRFWLRGSPWVSGRGL
jgi:DNA-3-methyladenine glycosylase